jgi:uncharacterized protein
MAEGVPYHLLLRTARYRWWRPLVGLLVLGATFVVAGILLYAGAAILWLLAGGTEKQVFDDLRDIGSPAGFLVANLTLAAGIPAACVAVALVHREPVGVLASVIGRLRWGFLVRVLPLALLVTVVSYFAYQLLPGSVDTGTTEPADVGWPGGSTFAALALVTLLTTPLQAAGEEFLFRGYLTQALGAWFRRPEVPALVSAGLFALAHGSQSAALFVDRFAFGLVASWLALRTGGLEASIALHTVTNMVSLLIAAASGQFAQAFTTTDVSWAVAVVDVASMVAFALLVVRLTRRRSAAAEPTYPRGAA